MNNNFSGLGFQACVLLFLAVFIGLGARGQNIVTIAGTGNDGHNGESQIATLAEINGLAGAAIDEDGNTYIADFNGNRIRKISPSGIITTIAGSERPGFSGDGGPATDAKLFGPSGIALDKKGNIYFADSYNQRIRKINQAEGGIITTIAGTGMNGFSGNDGPATLAKLQMPSSVAVDANGNVYIADCDNNCIRKVDHKGIITAFAGNGFGSGTGRGTFSGDGDAAINAAINHPKSLAVDAPGNVYIADCFNHRIRKVNTNGIITTIAGKGEDGYSGDMGKAIQATLNYPNGVAVDASGNIYISDHSNNRVRMVNTQGIISTVAGNGAEGFGGDDGLAVAAQLNKPTFVTIGNNGSLYIGDNGNNRIRMVKFSERVSITNIATPAIKAHHAKASHVAPNYNP